MVALAEQVAEIRRWHPSNAAFGAAMEAAGLDISHQDRAALIKIAALIRQHGADEVSLWIRRCRYNSPQHVWNRCLREYLSETPVKQAARPMPVAPVNAPVVRTDDVPAPAPVSKSFAPLPRPLPPPFEETEEQQEMWLDDKAVRLAVAMDMLTLHFLSKTDDGAAFDFEAVAARAEDMLEDSELIKFLRNVPLAEDFIEAAKSLPLADLWRADERALDDDLNITILERALARYVCLCTDEDGHPQKWAKNPSHEEIMALVRIGGWPALIARVLSKTAASVIRPSEIAADPCFARRE